MRTTLTLTLEPDVAEYVGEEVERTGKRMKEIVNQALRLGLGMAKARPRFEIQPHSFRFNPDLDLNRMHQLLDDLEAEEVARRSVQELSSPIGSPPAAAL